LRTRRSYLGRVLFAVSLLLRQPPEPVTRNDLIFGVAVTVAALVPSAKASWIALTGLGLYGLRCFEPGAPARRAAFVILAVTVPMFWSRLAFAMLSDLILQADAILVSLIVATERVGNTIWVRRSLRLSLYPTGLFVAGGCLSRGVGVDPFYSSPPAPAVPEGWWCLAACSAVIVINVTRIALIGLHREHFELLHGAVGAGVAGFLALVAIVGINLIRVRGDLFARS